VKDLRVLGKKQLLPSLRKSSNIQKKGELFAIRSKRPVPKGEPQKGSLKSPSSEKVTAHDRGVKCYRAFTSGGRERKSAATLVFLLFGGGGIQGEGKRLKGKGILLPPLPTSPPKGRSVSAWGKEKKQPPRRRGASQGKAPLLHPTKGSGCSGEGGTAGLRGTLLPKLLSLEKGKRRGKSDRVAGGGEEARTSWWRKVSPLRFPPEKKSHVLGIGKKGKTRGDRCSADFPRGGLELVYSPSKEEKKVFISPYRRGNAVRRGREKGRSDTDRDNVHAVLRGRGTPFL